MQLLQLSRIQSWWIQETVDERKENSQPSVKEPGKSFKPEYTSQNKIVCYGCGEQGYFCSNCPVCTQNKTNLDAQAIHFYSLHTLLNITTQVPTITITVSGICGVAHNDTTTKTSVTGRTLYEQVKHILSITFEERQATVTLAVGRAKNRIFSVPKLMLSSNPEGSKSISLFCLKL